MRIGRPVHGGASGERIEKFKGVLPLLVGLALVAMRSSPAIASTAYGDLNNFDVFNDTGTECHGFEIELDDVHSVDITYTFDWNHYGAPTISEDNSNPLHPKVFVRYAAKYGNGGFSAFTAIPATAPSPTDGHMCTDPSVNIGCEHFGVGYYGTPSAVKYNWLTEDPLAPGSLIHGPAVNVATPTWTYLPPAPAQPVAQVQAVILAPPPPPAPIYEFGDAEWVKSIVTTSHNNGIVELKDLVSDDPADPNDVNWRNGEPDEVEIEWQILQTEFNNPNGANNELAGNPEELPNGDEVVTRRYEFYKYTGPLDPETNEAKCDKYPPISDPADPAYKAECDPSLGSIVGDYIGAQMAGFDVEAVLGLIDHVQDGNLDEPYVPRTVVVGGNTPYATTITAGALPPGLVLDPTTGILSGTPTAGGVFSFTVTTTDADSVQVSKSYTITIASPADLCTGVVCSASDACHQAGVCDPATGLCSDPPAPDGSPCDDGNACTQTDRCEAGMCTGSNAIVCSASDQCHVAGICNVATGLCSDPPAPDGTACNDGDICTLTDTCHAGSCAGAGANPVCGSGDVKLQLHTDKKVKLGKTIDYLLRIKNRGPDAATAVVATLTCSGTFHVTTVSPGCSAGASTVACALGTLSPKQSAAIGITLVADAPGLVTCTADVSSATSDPVPTNQTKTGDTKVQ